MIVGMVGWMDEYMWQGGKKNGRDVWKETRNEMNEQKQRVGGQEGRNRRQGTSSHIIHGRGRVKEGEFKRRVSRKKINILNML